MKILQKLDGNRLEELYKEWRFKAEESRKEAVRIHRTVKCDTSAEERCIVRAIVWEDCAKQLKELLDA